MVRLGFALAVLLVCACAGGASGVELQRDDAVGLKFGAPGPRVCSDMSEPINGTLTSDEARAYVICGYEQDYQGGSELLYLLGDVQVQIVQERPFNDDGFDGIDVDKPVYDIAGSSVVYECVLNGGTLPVEQQCSRTPNSNDTGVCYQLLTGDWRCNWGDTTAPMSTDTRLRVPAPRLAEAD
jgi:hypothetical protein